LYYIKVYKLNDIYRIADALEKGIAVRNERREKSNGRNVISRAVKSNHGI